MPLNQSQKDYIIENYPKMKTKDVAEYLAITTKEVGIFAQNQKLKKLTTALYRPNSLSQEQIDLIFEHYEYGNFDWLSKVLGKSKHAITEWARKRGLARKVNVRRNGTMEPLINGSLESFYWLGFIAADGYIYKNGHLMVSQSEKDKSNSYRLAKFLETDVYVHTPSSWFENSSDAYRVNISDKKIGKQIREMFNIQDDSPKTYTGISLDFIKNQEQAISFLCGFIDGDGSLTKHGSYNIQCHKSWFETFVNLCELIPFESNCRVRYEKSKKDSFAVLSFKKKESEQIRQFALSNKLPVSERKF